MTQEDKNLLLKDFSTRLPYQVKVSVNGDEEPWTLKGMFDGEYTGLMLILEPPFPTKDVYPKTLNRQLSQCKPYLRPMSSMTEEEKLMYEGLMIGTDNVPYMLDVIDWLNAHHFDYRGLIDKGLAIEVTEENNPYKD